jgi:hypothetical protein
MRYFAIVKNNIVESVIVSEEALHIEGAELIEVSEDKRPGPGDSYYAESNTFVANDTTLNLIEATPPEHLLTGTDEGFPPFRISKYEVSYESGIVTIGCKKYSARGLLDALHKVLDKDHTVTSHFEVRDEGPAHGKFGITWDDAEQLYAALKKVKL